MWRWDEGIDDDDDDDDDGDDGRNYNGRLTDVVGRSWTSVAAGGGIWSVMSLAVVISHPPPLPHHPNVRAVTRGLHSVNGLQVELQLAYVAAVTEPHVQQHIHVSERGGVVVPIFRPDNNQFTLVAEKRFNGESQLNQAGEDRARPHHVHDSA